MHFEKLTPAEDIDIKNYEEAIDFVFSNNDVNNVAISGSYGAGKSSIMAAYEKKHSDKKFLHISLAHFEGTSESNDKKTINDYLEGKIVNQLLHQLDEKDIPLTNFDIKHHNENHNCEICKNSLFFSSEIPYWIFQDDIRSFIFSIESFSQKDAVIINIVIMVVMMYICCRFAVEFLYNNKQILKKFKFDSAEIELFQNEDASYFDKYLNDVLYLFEQSNAEAIVFEDIDRFNDIVIFERLREINVLINTRKLQKKDGCSMKFFYLVRDDLFTTKDRTKFFDYIIPIIPVIDGSNAHTELYRMFDEAVISNKMDRKFLKRLSVFIDDMRLLKNIYNEYVLYYNQLNYTELNCDKMLAIITYKNIFPKDFSELQLGKGYVFNVFQKKQDIIEKEYKTICEKESAINQKIEASKNEVMNSKYELAIFIYHEKMPYTTNYDGQEQLVNIVLEYVKQHNLSQYEERFENIDLKDINRRNDIIEQLKQIKKEKSDILSKSLCELLSSNNECKAFDIIYVNEIGKKNTFEDIKGNSYYTLLKYLLRNGYIDESYTDYMTYFYPGGIKKTDKIFLQSVWEGKGKPFSYKLINPAEVIDSLRDTDYDKPEILNYGLFRYLIQSTEMTLQRERFIMQLQKSKNFKFIYGFVITYNDMFGLAVKYICQIWQSNFYDLLASSEIREYFVFDWAIKILENISREEIVDLNLDNALSEYLSEQLMIPDIESDQRNNLLSNLIALHIKFKNISEYASNDWLLDGIYQNDLYEFNMDNILHILTEKYKYADEQDLKRKNYSLLRNLSGESIYSYVHGNIAVYAKMWLESTDVVEDEYDAVKEFLNNNEIPINIREQYICKLKTLIIDLTDIEDKSFYFKIMESNVVMDKPENIFEYYLQNGLDENLVSFINNSKKCSMKMMKTYSKYQNFVISIMKCNELDNDKYKKIICEAELELEDFTYIGIKGTKMDILIQNRIVPFNLNTLNFMRENYSANLLYYIKHNFKSYILEMPDSKFYENDMNLLMDSYFEEQWADEELFVELLNNIDKEISLNDRYFTDGVMSEIIKNHLVEEDLTFLCDEYDKFSDSIQNYVWKVALQHINYIVESNILPSDNLLLKLLQDDSLEEEYEVDLLCMIINRRDRDFAINCLKKVGRSDFADVLNSQAKRGFDNNEFNRRLLECLKERGYIGDYNYRERSEKYFVSYKKQNIKHA